MKIFLLSLFILFSTCFIVLIIALNVNAQEFTQEEAKEIELLKLKTGDLIDSAEISPEVIAYSYAGAEVENGSKILFKDNSSFSNLEIIDDTQLKVYFNNHYYRDKNNFVKEIQFATTTKEIWDKANVQTITDKILSFFKISYVFADTATTTSGITHMANCADFVNTNRHFEGYASSGCFTNTSNCNVPIIKSTLPAGSGTITGVDLYVYKTYGTANKPMSLYHLRRNDVDIDQCTWNIYKTANNWGTAGALNTSSDYYNTVVDTTNHNVSNNSWVVLNLMAGADNPLTLTWGDIVSLKLTDDTLTGDNDTFNLITDTGADASKHPYLLITYTAGGGTTTPATTTPLNCIMPANYDISVITGCHIVYSATTSTSTMATSSITIDYYYSPFLLYLFVLSLLVVSLFIISLIL